MQCFWLSENYYNLAIEFYRSCQANIAGDAADGTVWTQNNERVTKKTTYELIEEKVERVEIASDQDDGTDDDHMEDED